MDIEQSIDELKRWTEAKIHDLKKFVKKFGDIDLSLKCNFSSSAKKAYIEILIILDDKVKYLADLRDAIDKVSTPNQKTSINEIFANSVDDIEKTIDICTKIVNSPPHLLQENLCMYYIELISSQQVFKKNREKLYFFYCYSGCT